MYLTLEMILDFYISKSSDHNRREQYYWAFSRYSAKMEQFGVYNYSYEL